MIFTGKYPAFLSSEIPNGKPADSLFHVIPVPCEKTVSYGAGTAKGPQAILRASCQLELYDGFSVPAQAGIHTSAPVSCRGSYERVLERIESRTAETLSMKRIPVILGGEHTVTLGAVRALARTPVPFGVIQFDAHADLRDSFEGSPFSHACVMRRVVDLGIPLVQVGIRSLSPVEVEFRKSTPSIICHDAADVMHHGLPIDFIPGDFPENVYITVDIDALDPSLIPSTGTPEPGGLSWYGLLDAVETIAHRSRILGFDVVELAPVKDFHGPDFTAARLVYNMMGIVHRSIS